MDNFKDFIDKIEAMRVLLAMNKHTLCSKADIQPTYYSKLLKGDYTPNSAVMFALAKAVGLRINTSF